MLFRPLLNNCKAKFVISIASFLFLSVGHAEVTNVGSPGSIKTQQGVSDQKKWSNHGFYPVNAAHLPQEVREAAKSVFRVDFPLYALDIYTPKGMKNLDALKSAYEKQFSNDPYVLNKILEQVSVCKKQPEKTCMIMTSGTAFLMEDNKTMWTVLHNMDGVMDLIASANGFDLAKGIKKETIEKIKKMQFPVKIFNHKGNQVFGGGEDLVRIKDLSPWFGGSFPVDSSIAYVDHAKIELSRPLTGYKPLQTANDLPVGSEAYLVGAPRQTTDRASIGRLDSPGLAVRVSHGKVLSPAEGRRRAGQSFKDLSPSMQYLAKASEFHVAGDCAGGNSGGPFLDSEGKVVALFRSSVPIHDHRVNLNRVCQGVKSQFINSLNLTIRP